MWQVIKSNIVEKSWFTLTQYGKGALWHDNSNMKKEGVHWYSGYQWMQSWWGLLFLSKTQTLPFLNVPKPGLCTAACTPILCQYAGVPLHPGDAIFLNHEVLIAFSTVTKNRYHKALWDWNADKLCKKGFGYKEKKINISRKNHSFSTN
jgi:hypothetical protein